MPGSTASFADLRGRTRIEDADQFHEARVIDVVRFGHPVQTIVAEGCSTGQWTQGQSVLLARRAGDTWCISDCRLVSSAEEATFTLWSDAPDLRLEPGDSIRLQAMPDGRRDAIRALRPGPHLIWLSSGIDVAATIAHWHEALRDDRFQQVIALHVVDRASLVGTHQRLRRQLPLETGASPGKLVYQPVVREPFFSDDEMLVRLLAAVRAAAGAATSPTERGPRWLISLDCEQAALAHSLLSAQGLRKGSGTEPADFCIDVVPRGRERLLASPAGRATPLSGVSNDATNSTPQLLYRGNFSNEG